jgi:hypothetical protein
MIRAKFLTNTALWIVLQNAITPSSNIFNPDATEERDHLLFQTVCRPRRMAS